MSRSCALSTSPCQRRSLGDLPFSHDPVSFQDPPRWRNIRCATSDRIRGHSKERSFFKKNDEPRVSPVFLCDDFERYLACLLFAFQLREIGITRREHYLAKSRSKDLNLEILIWKKTTIVSRKFDQGELEELLNENPIQKRIGGN